MVDFHSHILPAVDDGSKSLEESLEMVRMLASQGVGVIAATPHFYADNESVAEFTARRNKAFELLVSALGDTDVRILAGAEISYYEGVSRLCGIYDLRLSGSKLLLMEMPMAKWGKFTINELLALASNPDIVLVIAHGERCLPYQSVDTLNTLLQNDILIQTNASLYLKLFSRSGGIKGLKNGTYHLIGSDCHNTNMRPPRIGEAIAYIEQKLGKAFVNELAEFSYSLINNI